MANYTLTPEIKEIRTNVRKFMDEHIYPNEEVIEEGEPAQVESLIKDLQSRTKKMGATSSAARRPIRYWSSGP